MKMDTPTITYVAAYATGATAVGTIGLAIATFKLAKRTASLAKSGQDTAEAAKKEIALLTSQTEAMTTQTEAVIKQSEAALEQVELSKRQSHTAELALNASIRPLIADAPPRSGAARAAVGDAEVSLWLPIQNIGAGVALLTAVALTREVPMTPPNIVRGKAPAVLAAGEPVLAKVSPEREPSISQLRELLAADYNLLLELVYTDVAGGQETVTHIIYKRDGEQYAVSHIVPMADTRHSWWGGAENVRDDQV